MFGGLSAELQCYYIRFTEVSSVIRMVVRVVGQFTRLIRLTRLMRDAKVVKQAYEVYEDTRVAKGSKLG